MPTKLSRSSFGQCQPNSLMLNIFPALQGFTFEKFYSWTFCIESTAWRHKRVQKCFVWCFHFGITSDLLFHSPLTDLNKDEKIEEKIGWASEKKHQLLCLRKLKRCRDKGNSCGTEWFVTAVSLSVILLWLIPTSTGNFLSALSTNDSGQVLREPVTLHEYSAFSRWSYMTTKRVYR